MFSDYAQVHAALLVFVRVSAALMTAPGFGSQAIPTNVRILVGVALSGAIAGIVRPQVGPVPDDLGTLFLGVGTAAAGGLLIGLTISLAVQAAQIAGTLLDAQVGLSMSQVMNPIDGVPVSILGQFKGMLALVIFLTLDAHHLVIQGVIRSYAGAPLTMDSLPGVLAGVQGMLGMAMTTAFAIAAPALGVSLVVDAALGLLSRAVPQLQPLQVGMPAKIGTGLLAVAFSLPVLVGAIRVAVESATHLVGKLFPL